jgi:hypothetical protein
MSDGAALEVFTPAVASACLAVGDSVAAAFIAPWAILQTAMRATGLAPAARLQALQLSYDMFRYMHDEDPAGKLPERGGRSRVVGFNTMDHLRRAMNLIVILFWVVSMGCSADLSRFSTHGLELRFGFLRCLLRGHTQWDFFVSAETYAELVKRFTAELGIAVPAPIKRAKVAGAVLDAVDEAASVDGVDSADVLCEYTRDERGNSVNPDRLRQAARDFVSSNPMVRRRASAIFWPYLIGMADFLEAHPSATREPSPDGFFSGMVCETRFKDSGAK